MPKHPGKRGPKTDQDREPVIMRLMAATESRNEEQLCAYLGIWQSTLTRRRNRAKRPEDVPEEWWLRLVAAEKNRHLTWLKTGRGPEIREPRTTQSLPDDLKTCLEIGQDLEARYQTALREYAEFFRDVDPQVHATTMEMIRYLLSQSRRDPRQRTFPREDPVLDP